MTVFHSGTHQGRTFRDRAEAGLRLGERVLEWRADDPVVIGLPRGGVPVAHQVARMLGAPLDILVVRKIGAPDQPELALGAVGEGGIRLFNHDIVTALGIGPRRLEQLADATAAEVAERTERLRGPVPALDWAGRTVVLVDDGVATGATVRAAMAVLRRHEVGALLLAVPVTAPEALRVLGPLADDLVCLTAPAAFRSVGEYYADFTQTTDQEVRRLLADARR
ncbi:phosphoribosyltransferase family protein [Kitasatospora sp. NBC_01287]|uniref:phosphoribosyltransferase n=1 Tax=Kitasatospora sp. NBC_01287 TaxID=2903573 RepID=UPI002257F784|nr:phosphoribosyltransferase family protein [Kitasatospora sp. NBC_01287]MCX4751495.1 phosphoribosyltransferase family protein [Kitasatospora sp. NBC_01287]